jgi:hypothetical protein
VAQGVTLTVEGALTLTGATLNGAGSGTIVFSTGATVTDGAFYNAGEKTMTAAEVKGTYEWKTDAGGAGTAGWQEAFTPVAEGTYTLVNPANSATAVSETGLLIAHARTSIASKIVYIKLGGEVTGKYTLKATGDEGDYDYTEGSKSAVHDWFGIRTKDHHGAFTATAQPAPGSYAVARIKGLYDTKPGDRTMGIKQTNQAYRIYQYDETYQDPGNNLLLTVIPTLPKKSEGGQAPILWDPEPNEEDAPVVWSIGPAAELTSEKTFAFPIWDGGTETGLSPYNPETVEIKITEYGNIYDTYNDAEGQELPDPLVNG